MAEPQVEPGAPAPALREGPDAIRATLRVGSRRRLALQLLASLVIAAIFVRLLQVGAMPVIPDRAAFARLRWWVLPAYLLGWSVVHLLRAARWRLLLAPIGQIPMRRVLEASFLGYLAILVLPLRAGEVVRPMLIRRGGEVSAWAAAGTIGAERIVDGLTMSALLFVALQAAPLLDPLPETLGDLPIRVAIIPGAAYAALLVFACALLVMLAFFTWRAAARRVIHAVFGVISPSAAGWVAARVESVSDGLRFLSRLRYGAPFVLVTVLYWLSNAACTWLLAWGVGFDGFGYFQACVVTGVLALGILVPNAPGFFGAFQFSLYAGLALFYPSALVSSLGAAFVLLVYLSQVAVTVGFAGWAAMSGGLSRR